VRVRGWLGERVAVVAFSEHGLTRLWVLWESVGFDGLELESEV
jgi:hypothetical protein